MRKIIKLLICIFIWLTSWNEGYSQGGLLHFRDHFKDAGGNIRKGEEIAVELRIVDGFGGIVLKERHVILTNEEGLGICWLGKGTTLAEQLEGITWERGGYSLEVIQIDKQIKKVWSVDGVIFSQYPIHTPALRKKQGTVDYGDDRGILYWGRQQGRLLGISAEGVVLSIADEGGGKWKPNRVPSISGMTKAVYLGEGEIKMESYGISEELKVRKGFVWDTVSNVGLPGLGRWEEEKEIGSYEARIKGFEPDKMYFIRSYISTGEGTSYGPETMIKTFKALPVLETLLQDTNIITGVGMGGKIVSDGGMALRDRGVAWSTSPNPTIDLPTRMTMTNVNMETRDYRSTVKDLQPNTTYYVRAYATNSAGTGYGNEVSFTTSSILLANLPVLTTTVPGSITTSTANSGGVISSDGGAPITARGVVWSTTPKPAITLTTKTMDKTGSGTFTSVMSFLSSNTKYYVRAYATNSAGTAYGEDREFTTLKVRRQTKPVVSTVIPSEVTASTARSGGKVSVDGGSSVTARGVVWSTKRSPTIAQETKTVDGAGLGDFISNLPNLASNTKYYVRAYATNGTGTEYGGRESFTTGGSSSAGLPVISTTGVTLVTSNTAQGGGNISADGGKAVTARGIIWSTSPKPIITLTTKTNDGPGTGAFTSKLSGLAVNTKYYVVAYATNANGTAYGLETNFTTLSNEPVPAGPCPEVASVLDVDGNSYNTIQIGKQCWLKENLKVTKYGDGSLIPLDETGGTIGNATGQTWGSRTTGARTVYNNNLANVGLYGYLYNWYAVSDSKGLCPRGWRVPTDAEWTTLTDYLGGELVAGSKMKSTGTTQWQSTNNLVKNENGFTALPGGYRNNDGRFYSIRTDAFFWTSTAFSENNAWYRYITDIKGQVYKNSRFVKSVGASVRCIKEVSTSSIPILTTNSVQTVTATTAVGGGNVTSQGVSAVTARGVVWSTSPNPTIALATKTVNEMGTGAFNSNLTGLAPNTTYYIKAYATNGAGTGYGEERTFKTEAGTPIVITSALNSITQTTAVGGGNVTSQGVSAVTARGVVWSTSPNPTITLATKKVNGTGTGAFTSNLTGLAPNTTYYIKAYATNATGTGYGEERTFITLPNITTTAITDVTENAAKSGGNITPVGNATITARGVVWSTSPNPTIALSTKTTDGAGTGAFPSNLTGLTSNTTYYVKAYATNSSGTGYGNEVSFKTNIIQVFPIVNTSIPINVESNKALAGGFVNSEGTSPVTVRGIIWSATPLAKETGKDRTMVPGGGTGAFTSLLTGLKPDTWYYTVAYATSSVGTSYGGEISFKTKPASIPEVTTLKCSEIKEKTLKSGGNVTADGGDVISARGVVWSTNPAPTLSMNVPFKTDPVNDKGEYMINLSELTPNTRYYVRAYATNSAGTGYGLPESCVTLPLLATTALSAVWEDTAKSGGTFMPEGNADVTAKGVVWSTSPNPTIALSTKTVDGTGTGVFTSNLKGLTPNTIYYVKAYATNATGTGYGNELTFTTLPKLTTTGVSEKMENTAKSGGNISPAGNAPITARGVVWSTSPKPTIALSTKTEDGMGTGVFTSNLTGLTPNTTYYVKAYSRNSMGTGYGEERTFKTLGYPTVSYTTTCNLTQTTASIGAEITSDGGSAVTSRGVVWSTSPAPTIALETKTNIGKGLGEFSSIVTGLTSGTIYYIRAYATSAVGTAYGDQLQIKTLPNYFKVICGLDIPPGWMYYRTISNSLWSSYCGSGTIAIEIVNIQNLPVGTQLSICYKSEVPIGWRVAELGSETCDQWITSENGVTRFWDCCSGKGGTAPIGFFQDDRLRKIIIKEESSFASCLGTSTVNDIDGNTYNTVLIGTQCWMQSNLKVSKYRNGDIIPKVITQRHNQEIWDNLTSGAYTLYYNGFCHDYLTGKLYNWYAAMDGRGLCPTGWHVPSDAEWTTLITFLGPNAASKMKSTSGWDLYLNYPNIRNTNESGFSAIPGDLNRVYSGNFGLYIKAGAFFWSSSENSNSSVWTRVLHSDNGTVYRNNYSKGNGLSVRCLRD